MDMYDEMTSETRGMTSSMSEGCLGTPSVYSSVGEDTEDWLRHLNKRWSCGGSERRGSMVIEEWHRIVCLDWLAEVRSGMGLKNSTYVRSAVLFNKITTEMQLKKTQLQRYAITCLMMCAKIEESCSVEIKKYADLTCGICDDEELKQTEMEILIHSNFTINTPTTSDFLYPLLSHLEIPNVSTAEFILEASCYSLACTSLPPTVVAASVVSITTAGTMDVQITSAMGSLFQISSWEEARVPVTEALEECFTYNFKNIISNHTSEVTHSTKAHFFPRKRKHFDDDETTYLDTATEEEDDTQSDAVPTEDTSTTDSRYDLRKRVRRN